jgi:hypothetical protein
MISALPDLSAVPSLVAIFPVPNKTIRINNFLQK